MKMNRTLLLLWLSSLLLSPALHAADEETYEFEMVIFERPDGGAAEYWAPDPQLPQRATAVARLDSLPRGNKTLGAEVLTLNRRGMVIHEHVAWRQVPGSRNGNDWYWIDDGRLSGRVRVSRGRFLHLDTDLVLNDAVSAQPYRIQLHRRMRSGELHYVDHPRLGILIQAERYRPRATPEDAADASNGEPKPAKPIATPPGPG